ncbi:LAMI_0A02234g1_1 [Lachancea mirantina]|uniref:LAMI_0A02234g1_1 n=1 Tax=Lachancea mirantina TaxID=1230905 RepID=A0A1G4IMB2_9SACH|nr:LAMI_0A02234g1_1 [Lachancea mirantina]
MATKSSSNSSKKKANADGSSSGVKKTPLFKIPATFVVRPITEESDARLASVIKLNPETVKSLEIGGSGMCLISKEGANGVVASVEAGDESMPTNVVLMSKSLRMVGNVLLGERVEIRKVESQPEYASNVVVGSLQRIDLSESACKKIEKLLTDSGIVMPGMVFSDQKIDEETVDVLIVDINASGDGSMPEISKLSLSDKSVNFSSNYLSPPGLFRKGLTKVIKSVKAQVNPVYNLPKPMNYHFVGGLQREIEILRRAIELPLHQPEVFAHFGVSPPRGILLHGPPGTGKTMLLRCIANEANSHVLAINGPSIVSKYLGETEAALREIFNEARDYQPSIVFIDEIDSLAPSRASDDSGEVESRIVATLLTLMDGMGGTGKVVVVAATNRPNSVDAALRRPGRFDQEVEIGIPDVEARADILLKQFAKMSIDRHELDDVMIRAFASKTHGYVGADLIALCREAVMKTIQRGMANEIERDDLRVISKDVEDAMAEIRPSAMREIFLEMPKVHWSDIGGQEDLKLKMKEMIQLPLEAAKSFERLGVRAPKGVLLFGPPGCSKTLIAKALATESTVNFLAVKGPEIFNKYVGESERAVREVFRKARAAAPSIIFFDEIDALSPDRDGGGSTSAASHVLTSLLNEIDGVEELQGVVIVAATNRPDEIDPALLRPGRLDRHVYVGPPDYDARLQIIRKNTSKFSLENHEELITELATKTAGCSGAEVVLLCQEAGLAAIMEDTEATKVDCRHFNKAIKEISRGITPEMLAYYDDFKAKNGVSA